MAADNENNVGLAININYSPHYRLGSVKNYVESSMTTHTTGPGPLIRWLCERVTALGITGWDLNGVSKERGLKKESDFVFLEVNIMMGNYIEALIILFVKYFLVIVIGKEIWLIYFWVCLLYSV